MAIVGLAVLSASAQTPRVAFDVVSLKAVAQPNGPGFPFVRPGRLQIAWTTAGGLVGHAFPVNGRERWPERIAGGPAWLWRDEFELNATTGMTAAEIQRQLPALLRSVLEDRFALRWHTEMRRLPVFLLEQVHPGALGPQLHRSDPSVKPWSSSSLGYFGSYGTPVSQFATNLSVQHVADREVIDRTGLTGNFDIELYYSIARTYIGNGVGADDGEASLFTALQEQLGLKLTSSTESREVLVVDHIERPTGN